MNHTVHGALPKQKCPIPKYTNYNGQPLTIRQYTRLTLVISDPQQNYGINSGNEIVKSYDIIAVKPNSERAWQICCTSLEIDLVTFDMISEKIPWQIKHGYARQAVSRGIRFEISYGALFLKNGDSSLRRKNLIGNGMMLFRVAKWKNCIVTSEATEHWQPRSPFDVSNLIGIFGVPSDCDRMRCIRENAEFVFKHAAERKHTYRGAVMIVPERPETDMMADYLKL